jgi:hypothetical protein
MKSKQYIPQKRESQRKRAAIAIVFLLFSLLFLAGAAWFAPLRYAQTRMSWQWPAWWFLPLNTAGSVFRDKLTHTVRACRNASSPSPEACVKLLYWYQFHYLAPLIGKLSVGILTRHGVPPFARAETWVHNFIYLIRKAPTELSGLTDSPSRPAGSSPSQYRPVIVDRLNISFREYIQRFLPPYISGLPFHMPRWIAHNHAKNLIGDALDATPLNVEERNLFRKSYGQLSNSLSKNPFRYLTLLAEVEYDYPEDITNFPVPRQRPVLRPILIVGRSESLAGAVFDPLFASTGNKREPLGGFAIIRSNYYEDPRWEKTVIWNGREIRVTATAKRMVSLGVHARELDSHQLKFIESRAAVRVTLGTIGDGLVVGSTRLGNILQHELIRCGTLVDKARKAELERRYDREPNPSEYTYTFGMCSTSFEPNLVLFLQVHPSTQRNFLYWQNSPQCPLSKAVGLLGELQPVAASPTLIFPAGSLRDIQTLSCYAVFRKDGDANGGGDDQPRTQPPYTPRG